MNDHGMSLNQGIIPVSRNYYDELVESKALANALLSLISAKRYLGISREEVEVLYALYCKQDGAEA